MGRYDTIQEQETTRSIGEFEVNNIEINNRALEGTGLVAGEVAATIMTALYCCLIGTESPAPSLFHPTGAVRKGMPSFTVSAKEGLFGFASVHYSS